MQTLLSSTTVVVVATVVWYGLLPNHCGLLLRCDVPHLLDRHLIGFWLILFALFLLNRLRFQSWMARRCVVQVRRRVSINLFLWLLVVLLRWIHLLDRGDGTAVKLLIVLHEPIVLVFQEAIVYLVRHVGKCDLIDRILGRQAIYHRVLVECDQVTHERLHLEKAIDVKKADAEPHMRLLQTLRSHLGKALADKSIKDVQVDADADHAEAPIPLVQRVHFVVGQIYAVV